MLYFQAQQALSAELPMFDSEARNLKLIPSPEQMATFLTDGSPKQKQIFDELYKSALNQFDVKGYNWLMNTGNIRSANPFFMGPLSD